MMREDSEEVSGSDYTEGSSVWASGIAGWSMSIEEEPKMRADARRSRARLLEAATAAFAENGADAPLDDIARRAGVGIGTLYRHFPTRVDLQAAVFRSQVKSVCDTADDLMVTVAPEAAFAGWLHAMAGSLATKRGLSSALIGAVGNDSELISSSWIPIRHTPAPPLSHAHPPTLLPPHP